MSQAKIVPPEEVGGTILAMTSKALEAAKRAGYASGLADAAERISAMEPALTREDEGFDALQTMAYRRAKRQAVGIIKALSDTIPKG